MFVCIVVGVLRAHGLEYSLRPGGLIDVVQEGDRSCTSLTLTGEMDARDFAVLPELLPNLTRIDLSGVTIVGYMEPRSKSGVRRSHKENVLPDYSFFGMGLREVILPNNLEGIGDGVFAATEIVNIILPSGLRQIGAYAFYDCDRLEQIKLPGEAIEIGEYIFAESASLEQVDMSESMLTILPAKSFCGCSRLGSVILPSVLSSVGEYAFAYAESLQEVNLPTTLHSIAEKAFIGAGLKMLRVPESVAMIGEYAFACNESLEKVVIEGSPNMGNGLFFYCTGLQNVDAVYTELPDYLYAGDESLLLGEDDLSGVEEIGAYALYDNGSVNLVLHSNLKYLGDHAMEGMADIESIDVTMLGDAVPELGEDVFAGIIQERVSLKVAEGSAGVWQSAMQWQEFDIVESATIVEIEADKGGVKAWFEDKLLCVNSVYAIRDVSIYSIGGEIVLRESPYAERAEIDTSRFDNNIYIVVVTTENEVTTFKLIR